MKCKSSLSRAFVMLSRLIDLTAGQCSKKKNGEGIITWALGSNGEIRKDDQNQTFRRIRHWLGSPPILLERDVPFVLSDDIGQDFEVDLLKSMDFWLQSSFDRRESWLFSSPPPRLQRVNIPWSLLAHPVDVTREASSSVWIRQARVL